MHIKCQVILNVLVGRGQIIQQTFVSLLPFLPERTGIFTVSCSHDLIQDRIKTLTEILVSILFSGRQTVREGLLGLSACIGFGLQHRQVLRRDARTDGWQVRISGPVGPGITQKNVTIATAVSKILLERGEREG